MRTAKRRNVKNRTMKGGLMPNTKVHLIVRKSNLGSENLLYDLIIARPAFPFITDYIWSSMNSVDETLALIRMKEIPVKNELGNVDKPEPDELYKGTFEYGYNEIDDEENKRKPEKELNEDEDEDGDKYANFGQYLKRVLPKEAENAKNAEIAKIAEIAKNNQNAKPYNLQRIKSRKKTSIKVNTPLKEPIKSLKDSSNSLKDALIAAKAKLEQNKADVVVKIKKKNK